MKKKIVAFIALMIMCISVIPAATAACSHSSYKTTLVSATCKKEGVRKQICNSCGKVLKEEKLAKHHVYPNNGKYTVKTEPTCQHTGYKERKCSVCGHLDYVNDPKVKHSYTKPLVHTAPTCISKGVRIYECKWCGRNDNDHPEEIGINKLNHTSFRYEKLEWVREKGQYKYKKYCKDCGVFIGYEYRD